MCIDVCDGVMDKMNYLCGFILYIIECNLEMFDNKIYVLCFKLIGYFVILVILIGVLIINIVM